MINALEQRAIVRWLREEDPAQLEKLWHWADEARGVNVGAAVHLRGLIEISNHCTRHCAYCGLHAGHKALQRYRMSAEEILDAARQAVRFGYGTVVLQSGEDFGITKDWLAGVVRQIKTETPLAVTLSLGERPDEDLQTWREAGADRYLLRFETSDQKLFASIHPSRPPLARESRTRSDGEHPRLAILRRLQRLGYEVGSGIMVGLPGQTYASLADDIVLFRELDLDMVGIGPFIPHPATLLGSELAGGVQPAPDQVPNSELMVYRLLALTRLMCPEVNIPSTTALATINKRNGRELALQRGANVVMPNLTPLRYRRLYEIYPEKACVDETGEACNGCQRRRIESIGRTVGCGPGGRAHRQQGATVKSAEPQRFIPKPLPILDGSPVGSRRDGESKFRGTTLLHPSV